LPTCPECDAVLPIADPTPPDHGDEVLPSVDDPGEPRPMSGPLTMLRYDYRTVEAERPSEGWVDRVLQKKRTPPPTPAGRPGAADNAPPSDFPPSRPVLPSYPSMSPSRPAPAPVAAKRDPASEGQVPIEAAVVLGLLLVVTILALAKSSVIWAGVLQLMTVAILAAVAVGAGYRRDEFRAMWVGFAVFGSVYFLLANVGALSAAFGPGLPTSQALGWMYARMYTRLAGVRDLSEFIRIGQSLCTLVAGLVGAGVGWWSREMAHRA
jgi:hypothetical protein